MICGLVRGVPSRSDVEDGLGKLLRRLLRKIVADAASMTRCGSAARRTSFLGARIGVPQVISGLKVYDLSHSSSLRVDRTVDARADQRADIAWPRHPRQALIEDANGHPLGHMQGGGENPLAWRVDESCREVVFADLL